MSVAPSSAVAAHGGCHCGAVRFVARFPSRFVAHCHCASCRRAHGAAFVTWAGFPSAQVEVNETTTGMDTDTFANVATHGADGYGWHRYGVLVGDQRIEAYEANGNGGQLVVVVPEYELVVVMTGGNYGQGGIWAHWRDEIIGGEIIKAIRH